MQTARFFSAFLWLASIGACATAGEPKAAAPAPAISKTSARSMPEAELKAAALSQLGDILAEYPRPSGGKKPKYPLTDLRYWTTPRSGAWPNICRYQTVQFVFSPLGPAGGDADAPMRVSGLDLDDRYFLIGDVERDRDDDVDRNRAPFDKACAARDPLSQKVLSADREDQIVTIVGWLREMNAMSDEAFSRLDIVCDIRSDSPLSACGAIIKSAKPSSIASIRDCARDQRDIREPSCIAADLDSLSVVFEARQGDALPLRIVARELIYFADQRID